MSKKTVCLLLTVVVLIFCFVIFAAAEEIAYSGTCGENATWQFDADSGTLTISGTGPMSDETRGIWTD